MSVKEDIAKLSEEIAELSHFSAQAKLANNKRFLDSEINRLRTRKTNLEKELGKSQTSVSHVTTPIVSSTTGSSELGIILVNNYMWDQTNEYVKIYIEVDKKSPKIENDQLSLKFTSKNSFTSVFGKYRFTLGRLYKDINSEKSTIKITKSNRVIITLYKVTSENWPSLNVQESNFKSSLGGEDSKEVEADPNAGLMKLMKNMYDEGDDDMKRTIAKTWYESQGKKGLDPSEMQL